MTQIIIEKSSFSKFLFSDTKMAWFWLIVRLYLGYEWLQAGLGKVTNPDWVGGDAGKAMAGFIKGALAKTAGAHPDVSSWYASFLQNMVTPHLSIWSHAIAFGELFVGIGLILGALTGIAAFFGFFMNLNYLLAGTVSTNPILLILAIGIMLSWKIAGYIGIDRFLLPYFYKSRQ
jgi:thiosulfate dehydrogenase [quinone] large subunit